MEQAIPVLLQHAANQPVLAHPQDASAHSDISEALLKAVKPLGDVQTFCPDPSRYRYVVVSTKGVVFGFAVGMNMLAFRLPPPFPERALASGGATIPELGKEWISFTLFRDDWPAPDIVFWARKAYVGAREIGH